MKISRMPRLETWAAPAREDPRAVSLGPNAEPATSSGIFATVRCPHAAHAEANA